MPRGYPQAVEAVGERYEAVLADPEPVAPWACRAGERERREAFREPGHRWAAGRFAARIAA